MSRWCRCACALVVIVASACAARQDVPASSGAGTASIEGTVWEWTGTITPVDEIVVATPERYTLELAAGGTASVRFDCNRGSGQYTLSDRELGFGPFMSTRMACPEDSLDLRYEKDLSRVKTFFLTDGMLHLELPYDSGVMRFRPAAR